MVERYHENPFGGLPVKLDVLNATGDYLPVLTLTFTNHQKASADDLQRLG